LPLSGSNKIPLGPILSPSLAVLASTAEGNDTSMTVEKDDVSTEASDASVSAEANVVSVSAKVNDFSVTPFSDSKKSDTDKTDVRAQPSTRPQYAFRSSPPRPPALVSVPYFETQEPTIASLSNLASSSQDSTNENDENDSDFGMKTEELDIFA
jgi:hypothetical protein